MKKVIAALSLAVVFAVAPGATARAEDKILGTVTRIQVAPDGASAVATLKDGKTGQSVELAVEDKVTLDKLKDHRIAVGDEIKAKFEPRGSKKVSTFFKKPGGC